MAVLINSRCTDKVPGSADLVKFRSPDKLSVTLSFTFIPDYILFSVRQAFNGIGHANNQSVIAVCSAFAVYRIGSGKVVFLILFIISNAGIGPFLDQRLFCLCKVCRTADGSPDGVLHTFLGGVRLLQIVAVPADRIFLFFAVGIFGRHFAERLVQRFLDVLSRLYSDFILFVILKRCIVRVGKFLRYLVILSLSKSSLRSPHSVLRRVLCSRDHEICLFSSRECFQIL